MEIILAQDHRRPAPAQHIRPPGVANRCRNVILPAPPARRSQRAGESHARIGRMRIDPVDVHHLAYAMSPLAARELYNARKVTESRKRIDAWRAVGSLASLMLDRCGPRAVVHGARKSEAPWDVEPSRSTARRCSPCGPRWWHVGWASSVTRR